MALRPLPGLLIVLLIACIPIFAHLDDVPVQLWDEGRLANNAIEMYETGDPLVVTYDYQPDMWNTKPPLMIWLQVLSLKTFGLNDLAFRLPTSLSALFLCFFLYYFFTKKYKLPWLGILASVVLVTIPCYIRLHGARTGDYDATLALFMTMYSLFFFQFLEENRKLDFRLFIAFLICAGLTKGIAGLLFLPALFIYSVYKKKVITLMKMPAFYWGIGAFLLFFVGYYLLREVYNPGYIAAVKDNELGGRFSKDLLGHSGGPLYYYEYIINEGFKPWFTMYALGVVVGLASPKKPIRDLTVYMLVTCLTFLVIISFGATKLFWYTMPMYPLMAIQVAIFMHTIATMLYDTIPGESNLFRKILPCAFVLVACVDPAKSITNYVMNAQGDQSDANDTAIILKRILKKGYPYQKDMRLVAFDYQSGLNWYIKVFKHHNIPVTQQDIWGINDGEYALAYQDSEKEKIENFYNTNIVDIVGNATIYQVHGKK